MVLVRCNRHRQRQTTNQLQHLKWQNSAQKHREARASLRATCGQGAHTQRAAPHLLPHGHTRSCEPATAHTHFSDYFRTPQTATVAATRGATHTGEKAQNRHSDSRTTNKLVTLRHFQFDVLAITALSTHISSPCPLLCKAQRWQMMLILHIVKQNGLCRVHRTRCWCVDRPSRHVERVRVLSGLYRYGTDIVRSIALSIHRWVCSRRLLSHPSAA
jgi:hypothetical protein